MPGPFLLETENLTKVKDLNFLIQFMSVRNKYSHLSHFSESLSISLKRQRDLIGHVLLYTSHHHTAALAFYFILADNVTWHLFVFEF